MGRNLTSPCGIWVDIIHFQTLRDEAEDENQLEFSPFWDLNLAIIFKISSFTPVHEIYETIMTLFPNLVASLKFF